MGELLDRWLELARKDFSPTTTTREVRGYIERNLRPALGDVRLSKLTTASLDRYDCSLLVCSLLVCSLLVCSLLVDGGRNGRPRAPGTIRRIHGILRRTLAQGVRWGWLGVNPAAAASPPRLPMPEIAPPTPAQLAKLQKAIDVKDPEFVFVRLSAMTGARRSEMLALRWPDIELGEHAGADELWARAMDGGVGDAVEVVVGEGDLSGRSLGEHGDDVGVAAEPAAHEPWGAVADDVDDADRGLARDLDIPGLDSGTRQPGPDINRDSTPPD